MKKNSTLLITGGTGSFGQAVVKNNINNKNLKEIRILSRDEEKQDKLRREIKNNKIKFYIGDVRDSNLLSQQLQVLIIFTAVNKKVP